MIIGVDRHMWSPLKLVVGGGLCWLPEVNVGIGWHWFLVVVAIKLVTKGYFIESGVGTRSWRWHESWLLKVIFARVLKNCRCLSKLEVGRCTKVILEFVLELRVKSRKDWSLELNHAKVTIEVDHQRWFLSEFVIEA